MSDAPTDLVTRRLDDHLCFAIHSAGLAFNRVYKPLLDELGLTYPQYLVMICLWAEDDQTVGRLGERLFLESNTLTPMIKRLEGAGLVARRRDLNDERVVRVSLTALGAKLVEKANCVSDGLKAAVDAGPEEIDALRRSVVELRDSLRRHAEGAV